MADRKVWLITGAARDMGESFVPATLAADHAVVATSRHRTRSPKPFNGSSPSFRDTATGQAFNRGPTLTDTFVVATPCSHVDGSVIAAISAAVEPPEVGRLDQLGEELNRAVAELARRDHLGRAPEGE